jgi:asparagine synthase (glutamine-hydrolysing)
VEGVRKLKPGCLLTIDAAGQIQEQRYYAFEVDPQVGASQEDFLKTCDRVEAAMIESLRRRLISDVPVGMFLSSGIDSSLVCALSAKKLGVTPRTFTIGFAGDEGSEHETARAIAKHLGTQHSEHVFGASDFDSVGRRIGTLMDEPNGDRSCVPTYLLCKFAREQVTVALSGDGGDELFGGYGRYTAMRKQFGDPARIDPRAAIGGYYNSALPVFGLPPIHQALPDTMAALDAELDVSLPLFQHPARDVVHGLRQMDFAYYMPGAVLAKVDRMSMRSSLETRTPFLEATLLAEAERLPTEYCMNANMGKLVLREIAGRHLPREVALLPKKGFGMPASVFLHNAKAVQQEVRNAFEILAATRFFNGRRAALKVMQGAAENINAAWAFIVLGQWAAHFPARL